MNELLSLREDDLTEAESLELRTRLEKDPESAEERREVDALASTLASFSHASGGPSASDILATRSQTAPASQAPRRMAWWPVGVVAAAAAAAAALVAVQLMPTTDSTRAKGLATSDAAVRLEAVVDGSQRALLDGSSLTRGDGVVFRITTTHSGMVWLTEKGPAGTAPIGQWPVEPGSNWVGGTTPLAWSPNDEAPGARRYTLRWCNEEGGQQCIEDALVLHWLP